MRHKQLLWLYFLGFYWIGLAWQWIMLEHTPRWWLLFLVSFGLGILPVDLHSWLTFKPTLVGRLIMSIKKLFGSKKKEKKAKSPEEMIEQLVSKVKSSLKEHGIDANVEVGTFKTNEPESYSEILKKVHGIANREDAERVSKTDPIPLPSDPAKALFVEALNKVHAHSHGMAILMFDLNEAMKVLVAAALTETDTKAKDNFNAFATMFADNIIMAAQSYAHKICDFCDAVESKGIPLSDSTNLTVN